jgi:hypothetical protein
MSTFTGLPIDQQGFGNQRCFDWPRDQEPASFIFSINTEPTALAPIT